MSEIKFRVVDTEPSERQIIVRFFSDALPESDLVAEYAADGKTPVAYRTDYAITVPIPTPEGAAFTAFIMRHCPVDWFNMMHAVRDPDTSTPMPLIAIGQVISGAAPAPGFAALLLAKNTEIDNMRAAANASAFPYGGKMIASDPLSRSDIDGVANHIALFGTFPEGFPGGWKATDKTMLPLADVDAFRAMYAAMTEQGTRNFNHSQELKVRLAAASTPEEIAAITW